MISLLRPAVKNPGPRVYFHLTPSYRKRTGSTYACAFRERTSRGRAITRLGVVLMELINQLLPEAFRTARVFVGVLQRII